MDALTTFTDRREFERAAALLDKLGIEHTVISPDPAYARVGCPALVLTAEGKAHFLEDGGSRQRERRVGRLPAAGAGCSRRGAAGVRRGHRRSGRHRRARALRRRPRPPAPDGASVRRRGRGSAVPQRRAAAGLVRRQAARTHLHGRPPHGVAVPRPRRGRQSGRHRRRLGEPGARALPGERRLVAPRARSPPRSSCAAVRRRWRSTSACRARTASSAARPPAWPLPGPCGAATPTRDAACRSSRASAATSRTRCFPSALGWGS